MVIFDCNGVLVDSEQLATAVVSQEFIRAGFPLTPDIVARYFTGRRQTDMFAEVEMAAGRKLPANFAATVAAATLRRFRVSLETTDLLRFFEPFLFSSADVRKGKPAPDLFLHAAGKMRVEPR